MTLDTNILVYAIDTLDPIKQVLAVDLLLRARDRDIVIATQVLGEFLAVIRRKLPHAVPQALTQARLLTALFGPLPTEADHLLAAAALADRYQLQFWDSVIITVARSAGAEVMLTEDMQDGAVIDGMTLLNPFDPANRARLDAVLAA